MTKNRPWIIAHRGARDVAPENTASALKRAAELPVDGVEFDVQMSSDGVPVLFHDRTLLKVNGSRNKIADLTHNALEQIDWGRWFGASFANEPLTTLEAALPILNHCSYICIEIKSHPADQVSGDACRLTEKVVGILNQPDLNYAKDRALILSFDPQVLTRVRQLDADVRCVLNLPERVPLAQKPDTRHLWAVGVKISKLSAKLVQWAHEQDLRVFTYTCNGPRQVKKAVRTGADAIISDRPAWLIQHLDGG